MNRDNSPHSRNAIYDFARLMFACVLAVPTALGAQAKSIPIRSVTAPVDSKEPFAVPPTVRGLPDGRLLVNDQRGKRLLVFDSTMSKFIIVADSTSSNGVTYPGGFVINPLMRYAGDSSLLVDFDAKTYLVIDP